MKFITKYVVFGLVLWFALYLPGSARSAEMAYHLVAFKPTLRAAIRGKDHWRSCGDYFAAVETTAGKILHFNYTLGPPKTNPVFAFYQINNVTVKINDKMTTPIVVMLNGRVDIWMNVENYRTGLPCLANGTKI